MSFQLIAVVRFFLKPFRRLALSILAVTVLASLFESLSVAAFFPLFQSLLNASSPGASAALPQVLAAWARRLPLHDPLYASAALVGLIMAVKFGLVMLRETLIAHGAGRVLHAVKSQLIERYTASSYAFFLNSKQGTLLHNCVTAPQQVSILVLRAPQLLAELLKVVAIVLMLFAMWPAATGALALLVLLYHGLVHALTRQLSYLSGKGRASANEEQLAVANEFFSGIRQILTFRTAGHWLGRFTQASRLYSTLYTKDLTWKSLAYYATEIIAVVLLAGAVIALKLASPTSLQANLPALGVFALAVLRLLPSVSNIGRQRMEMLGALSDAERVHAALTEPPARAAEGPRPFAALRSSIVFADVSFAHAGRPALLNRLNLAIEKGRVTAIVGASGAGKSTMVNLLLGLFEPTEGRILIDEVPLSAYRLETWLGRIGFVSQEPFISHATVADNIRFGRRGHADEDVVRAARIAHAHAFITELPQGYDTVVGERGMKLSGGQQQRIAIARAMLGHPDILIFDEATSHLDTVAEQQVQAAIEEIAKDHTVILVAHRLSTVRSAERIVVLEEGRIVEQGSHEELLSEQGRYFHLVASGAG